MFHSKTTRRGTLTNSKNLKNKVQIFKRKTFFIILGNLDLSAGSNGSKILGFLLLG
jgi:hypothetical protein